MNYSIVIYIIIFEMALNFNQNEMRMNCQTNLQEESLSQPLTQAPSFQNNFSSFPYIFQISHILQPFFHKVNCLEDQLKGLTAEIEELKKNQSVHDAKTSTEFQEEHSQGVRRAYPISKDFSKHIVCPVEGCRRKYSSKIAMRAHIRKNHKDVQLN